MRLTMSAFAVLAALAVSSGHAGAQTKPKRAAEPTNPTQRVWAEEPTTVFGLKLGAPIAESSVPICPQWTMQGPPCLLQPEKIAGMPQPMQINGQTLPGASVELQLDGGDVEQITANFLSYRFDEYEQILSAKYGPPHQRSLRKVQNLAGATLDSRQLEWNGQHMIILLVERFGKITEGTIIFTDIATFQRAAARQRGAAKQSGARL